MKAEHLGHQNLEKTRAGMTINIQSAAFIPALVFSRTRRAPSSL
jgi:hypothetical protein